MSKVDTQSGTGAPKPPPDLDHIRNEAEITRKQLCKKADHNKNEALFCFVATLVASLTAPLFVTLGDGQLLAKIVPSVLSLSAAACSAWLQLRKPQQLWALYRDTQRRLEFEMRQFDFGLTNDYKNPDTKLVTLARALSLIELEVHKSWMDVVPNTHGLSEVLGGKK